MHRPEILRLPRGGDLDSVSQPAGDPLRGKNRQEFPYRHPPPGHIPGPDEAEPHYIPPPEQQVGEAGGPDAWTVVAPHLVTAPEHPPVQKWPDQAVEQDRKPPGPWECLNRVQELTEGAYFAIWDEKIHGSLTAPLPVQRRLPLQDPLALPVSEPDAEGH